MLNNFEKGAFSTLLRYFHQHPTSIYQLILKDGRMIKASYDTDYESDNGLEDDEEGYEEYHCILLKNIIDNSLFEINYHNFPERVECGGMQVI